MKLYPKKLRSIDDLEREHKRLKKEAKRLDKEKPLSFETYMPGKSKSKDKKERGTITDMLPISNPLVSLALTMLEKKLMKRTSARGMRIEQEGVIISNVPKKKSVVLTVVQDIALSYIKWKAIELTYKEVKKLVQKRKEKKAEVELHSKLLM